MRLLELRLVKRCNDPDFKSELAEVALQRCLETEITERLGAAPHEGNSARQGDHSGAASAVAALLLQQPAVPGAGGVAAPPSPSRDALSGRPQAPRSPYRHPLRSAVLARSLRNATSGSALNIDS